MPTPLGEITHQTGSCSVRLKLYPFQLGFLIKVDLIGQDIHEVWVGLKELCYGITNDHVKPFRPVSHFCGHNLQI